MVMAALAAGYGFELAGVRLDWGVLAKFATTPLAQASAAAAPWGVNERCHQR